MEHRNFFISYHDKTDREWAVWIANTLKSDDYTVYLQAQDIKVGDDFPTKMNEFLKYSDNLIAVWSKAYHKSTYCMDELSSAYAQRKRIVIIRIDHSRVDPLYNRLVQVHLSKRGRASGKKLLDEIHQAVPRRFSLRKFMLDWRTAILIFILIMAFAAEPTEDHQYVSDSERDDDRGQKHYEQVAEQGAPDALFNLGDFYYRGDGVEQDYTKAREYWEEAAEENHADALFNLGVLYYRGYGVKQDYVQARLYYEQAAEQNHADALNNLGILYNYGYGVEQNYAKARTYYEQATEKGSVLALYNLGELYECGYGVEVDYAKAMEYYQKAADKGDSDAPAKVDEMRKKLGL